LIESWTTQQVAPSFAGSYTVEWTLANPRYNPTQLDFSFLRQVGGNAPDSTPGTGGITGASVFDQRYPYQDAVSLGFKSALPRDLVGPWGRNVTASTRAIYDIGHKGAIVSADFRYRPRDAWSLGLGMDLIGSALSDNVNATDFISRYRGDERVHGGVSYVF
jgi:hypothetical protein